MPNWCTNRLDVQGPPTLLKAFIHNARGYTSGGREKALWEREVLGEDPNQTPLALHMLDPEPDHIAGAEDSIPWRRHRWGVKWDFGEDVAYDRPEDDHAWYRFDTPWGPPAEAFDHIARHFPGLSMALRAVEEGNGVYANLGWQEGYRAFEQDFSQQGWLTFIEDIFDMTYYGEGEPPEEARQLPGPIQDPPPPTPYAPTEEQLRELAQIRDARQARGQLARWLEEARDPEMILCSAVVVMHRVDKWTARDMIEDVGQPETLRFARGFTDGAREYIAEWALDQVLTSPPENPDLVDSPTLAQIVQPAPRSMKERIGLQVRSSRKGGAEATQQWETWGKRFQTSIRLLKRLLDREGYQIPPSRQQELQTCHAEWQEIDNRVGKGVSRMLGNLMAGLPELEPETITRLFEEAPGQSVYTFRLLEHPQAPTETLENALTALGAAHFYTQHRMALRALDAENTSLCFRLLLGDSTRPTTRKLLLEGTQEPKVLKQMIQKLVEASPHQSLAALEQLDQPTMQQVRRSWLLPLFTHEDHEVRKRATRLAGRASGEENLEAWKEKITQQSEGGREQRSR